MPGFSPSSNKLGAEGFNRKRMAIFVDVKYFPEPLNSLTTPRCMNVNDEALQLIEHMRRGKRNIPYRKR